jgi:hypothetical protein
MHLAESLRRNGSFVAVLAAILLTAAALSIATMSLIMKM